MRYDLVTLRLGGAQKEMRTVATSTVPRQIAHIEGISSKVLAAELKELELNGFVKRRLYTQTPILIEYELADYALTVRPVLKVLGEWGGMHRKKIRQRMKQEFEANRK